MAERWWAWLTENAGTTVQVKIARLAGVEQSATSRWMLGKNLPRPEVAIAVARRLNRPAVEALVAAGYLAPAEAAASVLAPAREPTNEELIQLIRDRIEGAHHAPQVEEQVEGPSSAAGGSSGTGPPNTQGSPPPPPEVGRPDPEQTADGVGPSPRFIAAADQRDAQSTEVKFVTRKQS